MKTLHKFLVYSDEILYARDSPSPGNIAGKALSAFVRGCDEPRVVDLSQYRAFIAAGAVNNLRTI
jgi:hypothetical protein